MNSQRNSYMTLLLLAATTGLTELLYYFQLEIKNEECMNLKGQILSLEQRVDELEQHHSLQSTNQSQKWGEFEKLAESLRTLSHTMATTSTRSPRTTMSMSSSSRPMQF